MTNKIRWDLCQKAQQAMWQNGISICIYTKWFGLASALVLIKLVISKKQNSKRIKMLHSLGMTAGGQCKISDTEEVQLSAVCCTD